MSGGDHHTFVLWVKFGNCVTPKDHKYIFRLTCLGLMLGKKMEKAGVGFSLQ